MRIALFDEEHFETLYPLIRLFDFNNNHLIIFTNDQCYAQLRFLLGTDARRYEWVLHREASKRSFIRTIYAVTKKSGVDLLVLNTVSDNFIFYALMVRRLKDIRIVLTLHDINTHFTHQWKWSLRRALRNVGKKLLVSAVREFNVIALQMKKYLETKLPVHKAVHVLPGAVFEEQHLHLSAYSLPLNVVVPGSVDEKRRDYEIVFRLLDEVNALHLPVEVTFLGGAYGSYGEQVITRAKQYAESFSNLKFYFSGLVPQEEFEKVLSHAHLIFTPTRVHTVVVDDVPETYGTSKSSGNMFDVVKHALPFIAPSSLTVDPYLEESCLRYDTLEDIVHHLQLLIRDRSAWIQLRQKALDASRQYTVEAVRERNSGLISVP
jgi:hypothetical protein